MDWKLNKKVEDVMNLPAETMVKEHREIFMFLLGEHAKRVTRLEGIAGSVQQYLDVVNSGSQKKTTQALNRMAKALEDFKKVDEELKPKKKKKGAKEA